MSCKVPILITEPASSRLIFPAFWPRTTKGPAPLQQSGTSCLFIVVMMSVSASSAARSQPQNARMPDFWPVCCYPRVDGVAATLSNTRRHRRGAVSTRTCGPRGHLDARLRTRRPRREAIEAKPSRREAMDATPPTRGYGRDNIDANLTDAASKQGCAGFRVFMAQLL